LIINLHQQNENINFEQSKKKGERTLNVARVSVSLIIDPSVSESSKISPVGESDSKIRTYRFVNEDLTPVEKK